MIPPDELKEKSHKEPLATSETAFKYKYNQLMQCLRLNIDLIQIKNAIKSARVGFVKELPTKYCLKVPIMQGCIKDFADTIEQYLDGKDKTTLKAFLDLINSWMNIICFDDGNYITNFSINGGFECLQSKQKEIEKCIKLLNNLIPTDLLLTNLLLLTNRNKNENCNDCIKMKNCIVDVFGACEDNTAVNLFSKLFADIQEIIPCKNCTVGTSVRSMHPRSLRNVNQENLFNQIKQKRLYNMNHGSGSKDNADFINAALEDIIPIIEPYCIRNGGVKAANEFKEAFEQLADNMIKLQNPMLEEMGKTEELPISYMCNEYQNNLRSILNHIAEKAVTCLEYEEETYLPMFVIEIYDSVTAYQCKDGGKVSKQILQIFNQGPSECLKNAIQEKPSRCFEKTNYTETYSENVLVVTKDKLCSDMKILKDCVVDIFNKTCSGSNESYQLVKGFTDAVYAPCSGCRFLILNVLLALLLIFLRNL